MNKRARRLQRVLGLAVGGALALGAPFGTALAAPMPEAGPAAHAAMAQEPAAKADTVTLTAEFFPDQQFRQWIAQTLGVSEGATLTQAQLDGVTRIRSYHGGIRSLEGMERFQNLNEIDIQDGRLVELDARTNPRLADITVSSCPLESLDVTGLEHLAALDCSYTYLRSLDVSTNTALRQLELTGSAALEELRLPEGAQGSRLAYLFCSHTSLPQLDLSNCPEMLALACAHADLETLDVSSCPQLRIVQALGNNMVSVHGSGASPDLAELSPQAPRMIGVSPGGGSFDMRDLDPKFDGSCVSDVSGGTFDGAFLRDVRPGQTVSYTYTDGGLSVRCELLAVSGNAWVVPLSISSWTEGEPPAPPVCRAMVGHPAYTYAAKTENPVFTSEVPTAPGRYICRATVPAGTGYGELVAEADFEIRPLEDSVDVPEFTNVPFLTQLASLDLPDGFAWAPEAGPYVGAVGTNEFPAVYEQEGTGATVECQVPVHVVPRNGSECRISEITNEAQSKNIRISFETGLETYALEKGRDYTVSSRVNGSQVDVVIAFHGNFIGVQTRTFAFQSTNAWVQEPGIGSWVAGGAPSQPVAQARYGTPTFEYLVGGGWQAAQPTEPGTYTMRATVPATEYYPELVGTAQFTIYKGIAPEASGLAALYRDALSSVRLPDGFVWDDPDELVGNAGEQVHLAIYTAPAGSHEYLGGQVELSVRVAPVPAEKCEISPIRNEYESRNTEITYDGYRLVSGVDYRVVPTVAGSVVNVHIVFQGNFTGTADRSFSYDEQNAWVIPLSIADWAEDGEPSTPVAAARYGEPEFAYEVDGQWREAPPRTEGTYRCRAVVPAGEHYEGLEAIVSFRVYGQSAPAVDGLVATYGQRLEDVALPEGFAWATPAMYVGQVGARSFPGTYTPKEGEEYLGGTVQIPVQVVPRSGLLCTISPITNEHDARAITVTDQNVVLRKGVDYEVSWTMSGAEVAVSIAFEGNYAGTVTRTFRVDRQNGWVVPLSISDWREGDVPVPPVAAAMYGEAAFSYLVDGSWRQEPPTKAGTYRVRAVVQGTELYNGLEDQREFQIVPATEELPGARLVAAPGKNVDVRQNRLIGRDLVGPGLFATLEGHPVSEVLEMLEAEPAQAGQQIQIVDQGGNPQQGGVVVGTGFKAWLVDTSTGGVLDQVTIVVSGDVLGNGQLTLSQLVTMASAFRHPDAGVLSGANLVAGDFFGTGNVTLSDLVTEARLYREAHNAWNIQG